MNSSVFNSDRLKEFMVMRHQPNKKKPGYFIGYVKMITEDGFEVSAETDKRDTIDGALTELKGLLMDLYVRENILKPKQNGKD